VELTFEKAALEAIAQKAIDRQIGARGLRAVLESLMIPVMYEIPSDSAIRRVVMTERSVLGEELPRLERSGTSRAIEAPGA